MGSFFISFVISGLLAVAQGSQGTSKAAVPTKVDTAPKDDKAKKQADKKPEEGVSSKSAQGAKKVVKVSMKTSMGTLVLELDKEKAPKTVENFISYVEAGHYNGSIFHRVIPGFMIQGGGFDENMKEKSTKKPIENEAKNGLKNERGTIAMARTMDPNSATAQFFINSVNNEFLNFSGASNPGYAVFGKVTEGMDVVDQISKVKTGQSGFHSDVPVSPVKIETVTVIP